MTVIKPSGHQHHERLDERGVRFIGLLSLLFGFTDALFIYVLSSYFAGVIGSDNVGGFYFVTFGIVFVLLWKLHKLLRRLGGSVRSFFLFILAAIMLSAALSALPFGWLSAALVIALLVVTNLAWVAFDVILEGYSRDSITGSVRGLHLTIMNAGFLFAPFLSTRILEQYDFSGVFFGATFGYSVLLVAAILLLRNGRKFESARMDTMDAWKKMLREKNLFHIYGISFALEFFYVIVVIYTPIYLRSIGVTWDDIGVLFTVMLLPFVLFQYPLGLLADKRFGEKEFLVLSLGIGATSMVLLGAFSSASLLFLGGVLFLSRVGAAGIEVLRDAYFYKQIDGGDDALIAFFRTARPAANIIGALVALPFLIIFPLQAIFFLAAFVLALAIFFAVALEDTPSERELNGGSS